MSEFLQALSQIWDTIVTNTANTSLETWLTILGMFAVWVILSVLVIRDSIKHPDRYKDNDKFMPPH